MRLHEEGSWLTRERKEGKWTRKMRIALRWVESNGKCNPFQNLITTFSLLHACFARLWSGSAMHLDCQGRFHRTMVQLQLCPEV